MSVKFSSILYTFILSLCLLSSYSQEPLNYRFQYLMIEDGLPQNTITCIAKDMYGFMWFGTNNGVAQYDSYNFTDYKSQEGNIHTLPDNLISAIVADNHNLVWFGSLKGLSYFDHKTKEINQFNDTSDIGEEITKINSMVVVNDQLWVSTANNGVYLLTYSKKNGYKVTDHYCTQNEKLPNNLTTVIIKNRKDQILVGTQNGYFILNSETNKFTEPDKNRALPNLTYINDIFEDKDENLFFSTSNGIFLFKNKIESLIWYSSGTGEYSLKHGLVNMIRQDISGQLLVASLGGLQQLNLETGQFISFPQTGPENFKINNEFINAIYCDYSGNVWIGTEKGGINKFNVFQNPFGHLTHNPNDPNSLNANTINSIYSEDNLLWIGTAGGGVNIYDRRNQKFYHYQHNPNNPNSLSSDYITSIIRGSNGTLYVGTWGGGLNAVTTNGTQLSIDRITLSDPKYKNDLVNGFISSLVNNPEGFLLIGTEGGLSKLDYKTNKFTTLVAPADQHPPLTEIGCAILDSKGYYWLGTRNGLFRFPQSSIRETKDDENVISQLEYYKHEPKKPASLPGDYIISLLEDSRGNIWVGTYGDGLAKAVFNFKGELVFENYSVDDGLSNNVVYGILEDEHNKIWISTDFGLSMLNTLNNTFRNFYTQDGLLDNQFYWSASYKAKDATLYFGGIEGLNYFNPENFYEYNYFPTPRVTRFMIYNQEVIPGQKLHGKTVITKPIYVADTIHLSYKDNNISLEFSSFDYYLPENSRYEYMLTNVDKDWVNVPAQRRYASYNNLTGGTYNFLIKASNCDGIWNEHPTMLTIIVTPPFWKRTWFKILLFISIMLITFALIQLQTKRIIEQKKILEEKVKIRTKKIEDQKIILEQQAKELKDNNKQLEQRQKQIEHQKEELEAKTEEILKQRDELIQLNEKVNEVNQMQLRFFTNISHEFRTPLTLIISPLERLINNFKNDEPTSNLLKIINRNANRLLILIQQLLEIRKIETGNQSLQVELTEPKPFLLGIFHAFDELAEKNSITYTCEFDVKTNAWLDKEKVENVIYNLLSNAFKFTPDGKSIKLEARSIKKELIDYLQIIVTDTGDGIDPKLFDKLFDRFQQVTESRKKLRAGTGIGLSMVKSLIDIMYGTITVSSEPDMGSTFTVEIPVSRNAFKDHDIDTTGQSFESTLHHKVAVLSDKISDVNEITYDSDDSSINKVLVIEDNPDMRSFICLHLSTYYNVIEAENGVKGYEIAKREDPDLIISDIMMPEMSGTELCKKIKNNLFTSHIPVILLTAKAKLEDQIEGFEHGADDYIAKPFSIELLIARVKNIIDTRNKLKSKFSTLEDVKPEDLSLSALDQQFIEKANSIIDKYFTDSSFDVDLFASEMFVSRSQLYSKLKAITNLSANEFINTYRLRKAIELLKSGTMQVSEIAYSTGFNDPKYFSRIFKKYYKHSPTDYLKKKK